MGFRPEPNHYRLRFEDGKYDGLIVVCTSLSVQAFTELTSMAMKAKQTTADANSESIQAATALFDRFADALIEWNVEDKTGEPVPATTEGVYTQQLDFILSLVHAWMDAVAGVSDPLQNGSTNGATSLGLHEMMEVSSKNHGNS